MSTTIAVSVRELNGATARVKHLHVQVGDAVSVDQTLAAVETEKTVLEVPSPCAGRVRTIGARVDDDIDEATVFFELEPSAPSAPAPQPAAPSAVSPAPLLSAPPAPVELPKGSSLPPHAGPSVRRTARQWGIDLNRVIGTGRRQRVRQEDLQRYVRGVCAHEATPPVESSPRLEAPAATSASAKSFAQFGDIEVRPLSHSRRVAASRLTASAASIPHVTQFNGADITELERFRREHNESDGHKLTLLPFVIKACASALLAFPEVNGSIVGDDLILKRYVNVGFAVETPAGLLVPVVHHVDTLSVRDISRQTSELAAKARAGKLGLSDQRGGCFTVSSLGAIEGTAFTPIINPPELAILGVSRHALQPRWTGAAFEPRLILPLSLSYDHRAIDGVAGARFLSHITDLLTDLRRALL